MNIVTGKKNYMEGIQFTVSPQLFIVIFNITKLKKKKTFLRNIFKAITKNHQKTTWCKVIKNLDLLGKGHSKHKTHVNHIHKEVIIRVHN